MSFNIEKQDRRLTIFAITAVFGAVIIIGTILLLKSKEENVQRQPESQAYQGTSPIAKEPIDNDYFNRNVENPEPPEYKSAQWSMPYAKPIEFSSIEWSDSFNPVLKELPDSIWWNFFQPDKKRALNRQEKEILQKFGFFLEETQPLKYINYDDMIDLYNDLYIMGYGENYSTVPVFISSDFLLHVYHVMFDRMLQDVEEKKFYFRLQELTRIMLDNTKKMFENAKDEKIRDAAMRNFAFFSVAQKLLDTTYNVDYRVDSMVAEEFREIASASDSKPSSILVQMQDYTQFKPRGHYTKSPRLERYFRTMMWFGRSPFSLKDKGSVLRALLITKVWSADKIKQLWKDIADPISMLIGRPDDFSPPEFEDLIQNVYKEDLSEENLLDEGKLDQFIKLAVLKSHALIIDRAMRDNPNPKEVECQFRFIGQRFIPDSYIFTRLTSPRVGTDQYPRNMPKSTDVMTVLGSPVAERLVIEDHKIPEYKINLYSLKQEFDNNPEKVWTQSMYWSWLNCLRALLTTKDNHLPFFMRSDRWATKSLLTSLGSWAELRHDLILYSKQSAAECGEGEEEIPPRPPQPKSYVEADLEFFNRFVFLIQQVTRTLSDNELLSNEYLRKNSLFLDHVLTIREITRKELLNQDISKNEYESMMNFSQEISNIVIPDAAGPIIEDKYKQMALIADVHTDFLGRNVLEVGVGIPQRIYVAVKDNSGGSRVCVGYVYSYYEFKQPMNKRLTDDEWKEYFYPNKSETVDNKEPQWVKELRIKSR
jgi:hypothetical protein